MLRREMQCILATCIVLYIVTLILQWTSIYTVTSSTIANEAITRSDSHPEKSIVQINNIRNRPVDISDATHVVVLSVVRNAARTLQARLKDIGRAVCASDISASLFVLESNSNDKTRAILEDVAGENSILCASPDTDSRKGKAFNSVQILDEDIKVGMQVLLRDHLPANDCDSDCLRSFGLELFTPWENSFPICKFNIAFAFGVLGVRFL